MTIKNTVFKLLPKQAEFLFGIPEKEFHKIDKETGLPEPHIDIATYQGGFGSGKTFCGSLKGLYLAFKYPGIKGFVGANTQDLIDNTTKVQYIEHLQNMGMKEGLHYWFEDRGTILQFINGSRIYFKTLSNPEQFKSYNLGFVEFEEGSLIDESAFNILISRLRQPKRNDWDNHFHYSLFIHTNPGGLRGWIYKRFINPRTKVPGYRYVTASTKENIFLHSGYVEMMEKVYSKDQAQELIEGKDVDYDNTVAFPDFNEFNIRENIPYNPKEPLILTCDFNYNPMCWYLVQHYGDCWYILRELIKENILTDGMCKIAQQVIDEYGAKNFILMGDAAGKQRKSNGSDFGIMLTYFAQRGYTVTPRVQKANPLIKERLAALRGYICNVKNQRRLFVDASCKRLIYNFDTCRNNLVNQGLKQPTDKEIQKDDNLRYLIHPIDAISYPIWFLNSLRAITNNNIQKIDY
ncbi:MAG: phage terminase large subunit [Cytophagales bacterium]|nr:phage terminase large subunit [Cytophagales bacterium]